MEKCDSRYCSRLSELDDDDVEAPNCRNLETTAKYHIVTPHRVWSTRSWILPRRGLTGTSQMSWWRHLEMLMSRWRIRRKFVCRTCFASHPRVTNVLLPLTTPLLADHYVSIKSATISLSLSLFLPFGNIYATYSGSYKLYKPTKNVCNFIRKKRRQRTQTDKDACLITTANNTKRN